MNTKYLLIGLLFSTSLHAQTDLEELIINAHPLAGEGLTQTIEVLRDDELTAAAEASLGDTVAQLPGIRSSTFGAAAGRPVIHGLGGPRVKTTEDRIDTLDVSVTSADHAVSVEPFIANQITVLKGDSVLLYGSGAIGGVVDTETGRIPTKLPDDAIDGRAEVRFSDNNDAQTGAIRLDGRAGESFAWHVDAYSKDADDYEIPGTVESAAQLASEGESPDEAEAGLLEGSFYDSQGGAFGLSWVGENGFIGASVSRTESLYGLVGGHEEEEEEGEEGEEGEEEGVGVIDLEQTRFDIEGELRFEDSFIEKINVRVGINDYEHREIEGSGEVGTLFDNDAWEGRVLVTHAPVFGFAGNYGIQLTDRDFSAIGEEAFVPPVDTQSAGFFWVGERKFGDFSLELGSRLEEVEHEISSENLVAQGGSGSTDFSFTNSSFSIGGLYQASEANQISLLFDYTERAPTAEELFSNGPHLATQTFDVGNLSLDEERGASISLGWAYDTDLLDIRASVYHNNFTDFIFQENSGLIEDDLPVFVYRQLDADFTGIDFELGVHLIDVGGGEVDLVFTADELSVSLDGGGELPRIPSGRVGVALDWHSDSWQAKLSYTRQSAQNDTAAFELPTESFDNLNLRLSKTWELATGELGLFLHGKNLTDDEQREHVSFVKDFAPLPGRRFEVGLRYQF